MPTEKNMRKEIIIIVAGALAIAVSLLWQIEATSHALPVEDEPPPAVPVEDIEPLPEPEQLKVVQKEESMQDLITRISNELGFDARVALRIASCESGFKPAIKNRTSSATGLFQFTDGTWDYIGANDAGLDRKNPDHATRMFIKWYPKNPQWWVCK